jgi:hypothetical protein
VTKYEGKTIAFPYNKKHPYLIGVVTDETYGGKLAVVLEHPLKTATGTKKSVLHIPRGIAVIVPEVFNVYFD